MGACCYEKKKKYGCYYNKYAIRDERNLAPKGWRIPSHEDWMELERYIEMSERNN
ncbi:MAG: hypothetical protein JXQ65_16210 [Candidatus Marinimicrobia bacterium]|nr:hypothetical protein [Candidatus Neomarinimicrobiota bacterium]